MQIGVRRQSGSTVLCRDDNTFMMPNQAPTRCSLNGPVASVKTTTWHAVRSGKWIGKGEQVTESPFMEMHCLYNRAGQEIESCGCMIGVEPCKPLNKYRYDKQGRLTRITHFSILGNYAWESEFKYHPAGNLVTETEGPQHCSFVLLHNPGGEPLDASEVIRKISGDSSVFTYFHDERGCLTEVRILHNADFHASLTKKIKRDKDGNILKEVWIKSGGEIDQILRYTWDKSGKQDTGSRFNQDELVLKAAFSWDAHDRISRVRTLYRSEFIRGIPIQDSSKRDIRDQWFKYDLRGNVIEEVRDYGNLGLTGWGKLDYTYTYDDYGNWIRRVERISGYIDQEANQLVFHVDRPTYITERKIIYHE